MVRGLVCLIGRTSSRIVVVVVVVVRLLGWWLDDHQFCVEIIRGHISPFRVFMVMYSEGRLTSPNIWLIMGRWPGGVFRNSHP